MPCGDMVTGGRMQTAGKIMAAETLTALETNSPTLAQGLARRLYALWLDSGISLERVIGATIVIGGVIEYLRLRMDPADDTRRYKVALDQAIAQLSPSRGLVDRRPKGMHLDLRHG